MEQPQSSAPFRVAIVGSGLAGLSVVLALQKYCTNSGALQIDVYDAATELTEIGAGITLWPRTVAVLRELGIADGLGAPPTDEVAFRMRKGDQPEGFDFHDVFLREGPPHRLLRAELQSRMLSRIQPGLRSHLSRRVIGVQQASDRVLLTFADGSTVMCDLVIGADGVHSMVRKLAIEDECREMADQGAPESQVDALYVSARAQWGCRFAYRGTAAASALPAGHPSLTTPMRFVGADRQVITYPLPSKAAITALSENLRTMGAPRRETVMEAFAGWEPAVVQLLEAMNACAPTLPRWSLTTVHPPEKYVFGRVVLVGDAAHAMLPYLGAGAGMAIDDGCTLGRLLSQWANVNSRTVIQHVLDAYEALRRPLTREMHARSMASAMELELGGPFEGLKGKEVGEETPELRKLLKELGKFSRWYVHSLTVTATTTSARNDDGDDNDDGNGADDQPRPVHRASTALHQLLR
ncbi:hypothetical protein HDZ31DRAFT_83807 [Schizophyllum fasciatum]